MDGKQRNDLFAAPDHWQDDRSKGRGRSPALTRHQEESRTHCFAVPPEVRGVSRMKIRPKALFCRPLVLL